MIRRAIVVGAGMSGLAAAHELAAAGANVTVLEASGEAGGAIRTEARDGFLLESGPDSFLTEKTAALELCRELRIDGEIIGTNPAFRQSFIVRKGKLHPTPEGFYLMAPMKMASFLASSLISLPGKMRAGWDLVLPAAPPRQDESLASFVRRRFGDEILRYMAQPLVAGIYTADAETLSLRATFPLFLEMEERYGSVIVGLRKRRADRRARAGDPKSSTSGARPSDGLGTSGARYGLFATLRGGLATLVDAVVRRLPPGTIRCGEVVEGVERAGMGWRLAVRGGRAYEADAVCLAVPGPVASRLVQTHDRQAAEALGSIRYASTVTVNLAYARERIAHPLNGFGFVVPAAENSKVLACTFSSVKFAGRAPEGKALLRAFMGGALKPGIAALDAGTLSAIAHAELKELLGISGEPEFTAVSHHPGSMPQYAVGHKDLVTAILDRTAALPGFALAGNAYDGIGLPDCIRGGRQAARRLLRQEK